MSRQNRNKIPSFVRVQVYHRDNFACLYCGDTQNLSLDHLKCWSKGGEDTVENLITACIVCNRARGTKSWRAYATGGARRRIARQKVKAVMPESEARELARQFAGRSTPESAV